MKKVIKFSLIFLLLFLTSCSNIFGNLSQSNTIYIQGNEDDGFDNNDTTYFDWQTDYNTSDVNSEEDDPYTYNVKTNYGEIIIRINPERIVTLANEATETCVANGISPVGYVNNFDSYNSKDYKDFLVKQGLSPSIVSVGDNLSLDIEKIKSLNPDLILGSYDLHGHYYDDLSEIAPTVFSKKSDSNFNSNFLLYSESLGKKTEAEIMIIDYYQRAKSLDDNYDLISSNKVSVLEIYEDSIYFMGSSSFSVEVMESIGFSFYNMLTDDEQTTPTNIDNLTGNVFFVSIREDRDNLGRDNFNQLIQDRIVENSDIVIYEVPHAIWGVHNGYLSATEMLNEIEYIASGKNQNFYTDNVVEYRFKENDVN
ncbi:MAG: ABC transporter substrate-binding protein [Lachnospirales bacterium]